MSKKTNYHFWFRPIRNQNRKFSKKVSKKSFFKKKYLRFYYSSDFVSYGDIKKMLQSQSPWGSLKGATRWLHQKISSAKISSAKNYPRSYLFVIIRRFYGVADFLLGRPNHKRFILDFFQFFLCKRQEMFRFCNGNYFWPETEKTKKFFISYHKPQIIAIKKCL